jgi:multiple sugar transport system permease protein
MSSTRLSHRRHAIGFLAPFAILFFALFVVPIGYAVYQSLLRVERTGALGLGGSRTVFAGLGNYQQALADDAFVSSLTRVVAFALVQVPMMIVLATALALLLDSASARGAALFRSAFFLPYGVPGVIASIMWGFLYVPGVSPLVDMLGKVGLDVDFLDAGTVLWSIANIVTWQFAGYNMLVVVAQLKAIDSDLFEAAKIDGANAWQTIRHLKLPLIRPAIVLTTAYTPNLAAYTEAFTNNNYSLAAAQSVMLALVACVLSFGFLRLVGRKGRGE